MGTTPGSTGHSRRSGLFSEDVTGFGVPLPHPYPSGIDVDEIGGRIVPNASAASFDPGLSQRDQRHVGEPDIDRLTLHVQAASRNSFAPMPEHLVGRRGSVAGDHLKRPRCLCHPGQAVQEIEQIGIDHMHVARAKVAQKVVDRGQCVVEIRPIAEVLDDEPFVGVRMREAQCPRQQEFSEQLAWRRKHRHGRGERCHELTTGKATHGASRDYPRRDEKMSTRA